jgi:hypothetical protein
VKHVRPTGSIFSCPSCGAETQGKFCRNCGEKVVGDEDYSLHGYVKELLAAITLLESKVLRSVWLVVCKPGYLSTEFFRGRRVRYMKPLQLFVFLNVVYYFSLTLFSATTFTTPLATQLQMNNYYPAHASREVSRKVQTDQISYEILAKNYDEKTSVLSRTLIFMLIPIFSFLFYLLFFRKRIHFVEHIVIATHFWSFSLILLGVILPVFSVLLIRLSGALHISDWYVTNDAVTSGVLQVCFAVYLYAMMREAYVATRWYCAATSLTIAWSFFHIVWFYRFLLFELTMSAV